MKKLVTGTILAITLATGLSATAVATTDADTIENVAYQATGADISIGKVKDLLASGYACSVKFGRKGALNGRVEAVTEASFEGSYTNHTGYLGHSYSSFNGEIMQKIHTTLGGGYWLYLNDKDVVSCGQAA